MSAFMCPECGESPLAASPSCTSPHEVASVETVLPSSTGTFVPPVVVEKAKAARPRKWRGRTAVYLNKAGERYAYYHISEGGQLAWTHSYDEEGKSSCSVCSPAN